ncbi:DUF6445 family protein [Pseudoalteromonas sp. SaAl2]
MTGYKLNPNLKIKAHKIEEINESVIVVDDFLESLSQIHMFSSKYAYLKPVGSDGTLYPGKRDIMPEAYNIVLKELIELLINKGYITLLNNDIYVHSCKLSLVTQKANELISQQKIPHIDSSDNKTFASVHYLSDQSLGGTAIYKYKPANLIKIDKGNEKVAYEMIKNIKNIAKSTDGYLNNNEYFEQVLKIEAQINRIVIYRSNLLHSADLRNDATYNDDIATGRLSIASFFRID